MSTVPQVVLPSSPITESETLEQLIHDCRQMAEHWKVPATKVPAVVAPAGPRGITVPPASAQVVAGMAEFGD